MPIFSYRCKNCSTVFEELVHINKSGEAEMRTSDGDYVEIICPVCQSSENLVHLVDAFLPRFTGPGFYETDYKRKPTGSESAAVKSSDD